MESLPRPPVPEDVDLRDYPFMPLDVVRLRDSEFALISTGDGFRAAVLLWCAAWHQQPAASLPTKPHLLASLAGYGRDVAGWQKVADEALTNFFPCSDGRLYHPTIAEKALESWEKKQKKRKRTANATKARLASSRQRNDDVTSDVTMDVTATKERKDHKESNEHKDPQEGARTRAVAVADANGQHPLSRKIHAAFVQQSADKGLTWPPTEQDHINRLVERAELESDPEDWCHRFLETAWRLKQEGKGIWKGKPWMPRTFCGPKAITWVVEAMADAAQAAPSQADLDRWNAISKDWGKP